MGFSFPPGGGGGGAGSPVVRKFPFVFDTPGILTGAALYTPTLGDILLDAWIEVDTAWNGTTPTGDVGTFVSASFGMWVNVGGGVDMSRADSTFDTAGPLFGVSPSLVSFGTNDIGQSAAAVAGHGPGTGIRQVPAKFTSADPIKVCVSQDGSNAGLDPGSTQGAAVLYLVTVTPA